MEGKSLFMAGMFPSPNYPEGGMEGSLLIVQLIILLSDLMSEYLFIDYVDIITTGKGGGKR